MRLLPDDDLYDPRTPLDLAVRDRLRTLGKPGAPLTDAPETLDASASWREVYQRLQDGHRIPATQPQLVHPGTARTRLLRVTQYALLSAATLAIAFAGHTRLTVDKLGIPSVSPTTYVTKNGQQAAIDLPDNSRVILNVASRLTVSPGFGEARRALRLDGEALFTVVHQQERPFTVTAGPSTTRVLGTSFVVRHYTADTAATVAVRDGRVMVQSRILTAEQQVSVGRDGAGNVFPASMSQFSFASGVLGFSGIPLPNAISQLNRWYDADIRLGDSVLTTRRIVGGFKSGSLTELSAILEVMFDVHIVRDGRVLTLYPNKQ